MPVSENAAAHLSNSWSMWYRDGVEKIATIPSAARHGKQRQLIAEIVRQFPDTRSC